MTYDLATYLGFPQGVSFDYMCKFWDNSRRLSTDDKRPQGQGLSFREKVEAVRLSAEKDAGFAAAAFGVNRDVIYYWCVRYFNCTLSQLRKQDYNVLIDTLIAEQGEG